MLPQPKPSTYQVSRSASAPELVLDCPDCLDQRSFVSPDCADLAVGERFCVDCGTAVVLMEPTVAPTAARILRHVA